MSTSPEYDHGIGAIQQAFEMELSFRDLIVNLCSCVYLFFYINLRNSYILIRKYLHLNNSLQGFFQV